MALRCLLRTTLPCPAPPTLAHVLWHAVLCSLLASRAPCSVPCVALCLGVVSPLTTLVLALGLGQLEAPRATVVVTYRDSHREAPSAAAA